MNARCRTAVVLGALLMAAGCSARRPVLYPNERLQQSGPTGAERDVDECMRLADDYVSSDPRARAVARDTAIGGGTGAAAGAVGGAIFGSAGQGAAAGAATGATAGLLHGLFDMGTSNNPLRERFVDTCLADRGYRVLGWD